MRQLVGYGFAAALCGLQLAGLGEARGQCGQWHPLGSGMSGDPLGTFVSDMVVYNSELIAGGCFDLAGGRPAKSLAVWDGSSWRPLGDGVSHASFCGSVFALEVYSGRLVAGGSFDTAGGLAADRIAAWDGSAWHRLGGGVNGAVLSLVEFKGELIVGGTFTAAGGLPANHVAAWDGSSWRSLGVGLSDWVSTFTVHNGELFAGGRFSGVWSWDGDSWRPLGGGLIARVYALTDYGGQLVAGGNFTVTSGHSADRVAAWDGFFWRTLGSGTNGGVKALVEYDGQLVAGGWFTTAGGQPARYIAAWDGSSWHSLDGGMDGFRSYVDVSALLVHGDELIAGGEFNSAGGRRADYIAAWQGCPACYPDCDGNSTLDFFDFLCFYNAFLAQDPYADCGNDGTLTFFDFLCFQDEFLAGCP